MDDKILDRIRKLLTLAEGNANENEAATALSMAHAMMAKHRIDQALLDVAPEEREEVADDVFFTSNGDFMPTWQHIVSGTVAQVNHCKQWITHTRNEEGKKRRVMHVIGRPTDASTSRYMVAYIFRQIDELCEAAYLERGKPGLSWKFNFKTGCAMRIRERLLADVKKEDAKTATTGAALVLVNKDLAIVKAGIDNMSRRIGLRTARATSSMQHDANARDAGRRAGDKVDLHHGGKGALKA